MCFVAGCYSNEEAGAMKDAMWMDQPLMLPGVVIVCVLFQTSAELYNTTQNQSV
jgi:hypothetical protein